MEATKTTVINENESRFKNKRVPIPVLDNILVRGKAITFAKCSISSREKNIHHLLVNNADSLKNYLLYVKNILT